MTKIIIHNERNANKSGDVYLNGWKLRGGIGFNPHPQDVYFMDDESAKKFLDDNIHKVVSVKKLK